MTYPFVYLLSKIPLLKYFLSRRWVFRIHGCSYAGEVAADTRTKPHSLITAQLIRDQTIDTYVEGYGEIKLPQEIKDEVKRLESRFRNLPNLHPGHSFIKERREFQYLLNWCVRLATKIRKHIWNQIFWHFYNLNNTKENEEKFVAYRNVELMICDKQRGTL